MLKMSICTWSVRAAPGLAIGVGDNALEEVCTEESSAASLLLTVSCTDSAQDLMGKPLLVGSPPPDDHVVTLTGEGDGAVLPAASAQALQEPKFEADGASPSRDTVFQGGASVHLEEI